eukprot:TRINITY_DN52298_c0_g1_i1.p1 TRINITY_DN52298_c0_g1~~TRINITY_DN52298_c0_g1_i1.p1  ORF type:complete len:312 (+),score=107.62 TRINITY_DN52298_c0_g1_i1:153-1088(+)
MPCPITISNLDASANNLHLSGPGQSSSSHTPTSSLGDSLQAQSLHSTQDEEDAYAQPAACYVRGRAAEVPQMIGMPQPGEYIRHRLRVRVSLFFRTRLMKMTKEATVGDLRRCINETLNLEEGMHDLLWRGQALRDDSLLLLSLGMRDKCSAELVMSRKFHAREALARLDIVDGFSACLMQELRGMCNLGRVALYLDAGACLSDIHPNGSTPVHEAALRDCLQSLKLLRLHGADPTVRDAQGMTPLQIARFHEHDEVSEFLLKWACDVATDTGSEQSSRSKSSRCSSLHVSPRHRSLVRDTDRPRPRTASV